MNLQMVKSIDGKVEYVLLPIETYRLLKKQIDKLIDEDYTLFDLKEYVQNPIALARIHARLTQEELAECLGVSQPYISRIEKQSKISQKLMVKVTKAIKDRTLSYRKRKIKVSRLDIGQR